MRTRLRSERGASALELAVYTPIMFFVIFVIIQFALHYHGNQVAHSAAREGSRILRVEPNALSEAEQHAAEYAAQLGGNHLTDVTVQAQRVGTDYVRVEVCGRAREIIKNITPRVCQHAEGPIEEFQPDI
ncbi:pilus assembly protein [Actinobacteria bacterium YIM 96077]|uniref:Pilus assembly protein n=1 Tax=Phytoactinopolyspora halophila TaxID=1981511 RepID=A0A329R1Y4_9ACTN|nr:TadE/TadG family type IV pilus assembly protein [Phytoactinopolyspora halophila]AYY12216.1 pilus assembly protein [Actinobacteria bacterium YIM 96077]RAW18551.1 pilus assembly protein [Phytoactinopolyspora halophila]